MAFITIYSCSFLITSPLKPLPYLISCKMTAPPPTPRHILNFSGSLRSLFYYSVKTESETFYPKTKLVVETDIHFLKKK